MRRDFYFSIFSLFFLSSFFVSSISYCQNGGVVSTLAGSAGVSGSTNATGTAASFLFPAGTAIDASGNIFVADAGNNLIRKIDTNILVSTYAGTGADGNDNGPASMASFLAPLGVAVDTSGNVYVADLQNNAIREITSNGVVSVFASGFNMPNGLAVDSSGNVYVGDTNNNLIQKISANGSATTLAGSGSPGSSDGTGKAASFNSPKGLAVDSSGNVYVADTNNNVIREISPNGVVTTLAGSAGVTGATNGTGSAASFYQPTGVAIDFSGNIYVADSYNNLIREITSGGVVSTLAGSGVAGYADGTGTTASFTNPSGVAVDSSGNVYVSDTGNELIRKIQ